MMVPSHDELIKLLENQNEVEGVDLSALDFEALEELDDYAFQSCVVKNAHIKGDALQGSRWTHCQFENCVFSGADLREAAFENCQFFDAQTRNGVVFRYCDLQGVRFKSCDLSVCTLSGSSAFDVEFKDCKMPGLTLEKTAFSLKLGHLKHNLAKFEDCNMVNASLCDADLASCVFKDCDLSHADLSYTNLRGSELTDCNLFAVDFKQSDLTECNLRKSTLDGFQLSIVKAYQGLQISADQQHHLLMSIGIDVSSDNV